MTVATSSADTVQPGPSSDLREELQSARKILDDREVILDKLGRARGLAERIMGLGEAASEVYALPCSWDIPTDAIVQLNPIAKAAVSALTKLYGVCAMLSG